MFCLSCQTHIQRKSLNDYFKRTTTCMKCQRFKLQAFEESMVPYHHTALTLKYSSILKDKVFFTHVMTEMIQSKGGFLRLTKTQDVDALMMALWMNQTLYLSDYLRLDFIEYIQALEAIGVVLISG